jgi:deoxyribose-phosphate aldolase
MHPFAQYLDFANHHANATPADIEKVCAAVVEYGFHAAFVNQIYVPLAKSKGVRVGTVISFPLGQDSLQTKIAAIKACQADEFDIVPNIGSFTQDELTALVAAGKPAIIKFILDPGYFTKETLAGAAKLVQQSGADFVKIGSGMGPREPTVEDVKIVREAVGPDMKIKVAGGVDTYEEAKAFIDAGVARIGTSHAVEIISQTPAYGA